MRRDLPEPIAATGVVAVVRRPPLEIGDVVAAVVAGGVRAVEVTLNTPGALEAIKELSGGAAGDGVLIGAGTILEVEDAEAAASAGAGLIVTPVASTEVVRWSVDAGIPVIPGAHTATEIHAVWREGATAVKVYPFVTGGVAHLTTLMGPLPDVRYLAFGGVAEGDVAGIVSTGAVGLGMGGWLTDQPDPAEIIARAKRVVAAVDEARRR